MKEIHVNKIIESLKQMCVEANCHLNPDVLNAIKKYRKSEKSPIGQNILEQIEKNSEIAKDKVMPICQDTGMAVVFCDIGQDVHIIGGNITDAINTGIRQGYKDGYLRKSVVKDPILRINTGDNTPAIIHYDIVEGNKITLTLAPKGFGSENMSKIYMLKPADGIEGVKKAVIDAVDKAGGNACPPMIIGVGIGGTFEKSAILAKKALLRSVGQRSRIEYVENLEKELLEKINQLGIGPQGLGGTTTALAVHIETFPTHIAGLPVAVNISCHVTRHVTTVIE